MKVLFIDTETTGLPKRKGGFDTYHDPQQVKYYNSSRLVQLSVLLYNVTDTEMIFDSKYTCIIQPNGFDITNADFHGITNEIATNNGVPFNHAMSTLQTFLNQANVLVGFNVSFDYHIILSEMYRNGTPVNTRNRFETLKQVCVMKANGTGRMYPNLDTLYYKIFGRDRESIHNAERDAKDTAKIFGSQWETGIGYTLLH